MASQVEALKNALETSHLVLVEFYTNSQTRNAWLASVVEAYNRQSSKHISLVSVDMNVDEALAETYRVSMAPAFLLLLRKKELWRRLGKLTVDELQEVLSEF
ncbi:thioredoxin family protein [Bacteroides sp.]|uniref:thioredoxin family protein n=1 Tax=Bacteroides sp. TaxID=29523 RepID=UPI002FC59B2A